ncbi:MAG: hypothetical protein ACM33T_13215 [Solirubrobacterales bacterium]
MDHRDITGIAVAAVAFVLTAGTLLLEGVVGSKPGITDTKGLESASQVALESHGIGDPLVWEDRTTGTLATITPARAWRDGDTRWCRHYDVVLASTGSRDRVASRHLACRDGSGRWSSLDPGRPPSSVDRWLARLSDPGEQVAGN